MSHILLFYILHLFTICNSQNQTACFWGRGEGANDTLSNTILNGEYIESGTYNGFPYYTHTLPNSCQQAASITELVLFRFASSVWRICANTNSSVCLAFCNAINDTNPTISTSCNGLWQVSGNADLSITVTSGSCPQSSCIGGITTSLTGNTPCTNTHFTTSIAPNAWQGYSDQFQQNVYFFFAPKYFSFVCAPTYDIGCNITVWDSTQNALGWKQMQEHENITLIFQFSSNVIVQCHDTPEPTYFPTYYPTMQPTTASPTTTAPTATPTAATIQPTTSIPTTSIPTTAPTTSNPTTTPTNTPTAMPVIMSTDASEENEISKIISGIPIIKDMDRMYLIIIGAVVILLFCLICFLCCCFCCRKSGKKKQVEKTATGTAIPMEKLRSLSGEAETDKDNQTDILPVTSEHGSDDEVLIKMAVDGNGNTGAKMDRYNSEPNMNNTSVMFNKYQSEPNVLQMQQRMQQLQQMQQVNVHLQQQIEQQKMQQQMQQMQQMQLHSQHLPQMPQVSHVQVTHGQVPQVHYKTDTIDVNQLPELEADLPQGEEDIGTVEGGY